MSTSLPTAVTAAESVGEYVGIDPPPITAAAAIKTIAFFDLETSGLPQYEFNRTKITELSLIACSVEHIRRSSPSDGVRVPRVLHKLSLCVNPFRMIDPESTRITGLDNFALEHEHTFDANAGALLVHFVRQLQAPVCLLAHNGDGFDFPLLRKELDRVGVVSFMARVFAGLFRTTYTHYIFRFCSVCSNCPRTCVVQIRWECFARSTS